MMETWALLWVAVVLALALLRLRVAVVGLARARADRQALTRRLRRIREMDTGRWHGKA